MKYIIGVDIGGTFTDLLCINEFGDLTVVKVPSTPANPGIAVINALERTAASLGIKVTEFLSDVIRICHGTTVSTNTILTLSGAKVGLLTTKGHRDSLEIRMGIREDQYDYTIPMPPPLVPRHLRKGIDERLNWNGEEMTPLNKEEVRDTVKYFREQGVNSIAICFLWSFRDPTHEQEAAEMCRKELPGAYLSLSSVVLPEIRDFRRVSTTVINSYVGPALSRYILDLQQKLKKIGYTGDFLITQSSAGVMSPEIAAEQAMRTVLSGPACGPAAGVFICEPYGLKNLMTIDMGGTSLDVSLIKEGRPWMTSETKVGNFYYLRLPMVDVNTIGAGGGSYAWLGPGGVPHVGPKSAGAHPGPACYMSGGEEPTCTDADLVLGYLNPDFFAGGEIKVSLELAKKAIREKIAEPLSIDLIEAARSIVRIINSNMVDGMSAVSVRCGEDPRRYTLVAAGGAGPVHAAALAKALGMRQVLIPGQSSVFCAMGAVISDLRHDFVETLTVKTSKIDFESLNKVYQMLERKANDMLTVEKIPREGRYFRRSMDMRYIRQFHEVEVEVPNGLLGPVQLTEVVNRFHEIHEALYAYRDVVETEIMNVRLAAFGKVVKPAIKEKPYEGKDAHKHIKGKRDVFFEEAGGFIATPIYDGDAMMDGNFVEGPAVLEERTTTIVVPPSFSIEVTKYGDFLMKVPE